MNTSILVDASYVKALLAGNHRDPGFRYEIVRVAELKGYPFPAWETTPNLAAWLNVWVNR